jgi:hypothetical protein
MKEKERASKLVFQYIKKNFVFLFSIVVFIFLFFYFSIHAAGPLGSDELLYADAGLRGYSNYIVMNRYTHIYLQLLFMSIAPMPLAGLKVFWGFIMSTSAVSVFLLGRFVSKDNNFFHGFFALLIFLTSNLFLRHFGIPLVDLTTMMMVMIYLLILLYFLRQNHAKWVIVLLGFLFFFAFKAKEFSLILLVTVPVFGFTEENAFNFKLFFVRLLYFVLGLLVGVVVLIGLNATLINDPLFGLRFSDLIQFRQTLASFTALNPDPDSYLITLLFSVYYLPFTLYLLSAVKKRRNFRSADFFIWVLPLIYVIMMTVTMIRSGWRTDERYLYPIIGVICALAPQFFSFSLPKTKKEWKKYLIYLVLAIGLLMLLRQGLYWFTNSIQMSLSSFVLFYLLDIFFIVLLGGMLFFKDEGIVASVIFISLLLMNLYFPLSINIKRSMRNEVAQRVITRFRPIAAFQGQMEICETIRIDLTPEVMDDMRIGPDPYEAVGMFNIYYDLRLPIDVFDFFGKDDPLITSLNNSDADYILITESEWQKLIRNNPDVSFEEYLRMDEPLNEYVLLQAVNGSSCP